MVEYANVEYFINSEIGELSKQPLVPIALILS